jgi:CHAT domain-containing protein
VAGDPPAGDLPGLQWSATEARQVAAALPHARLLLGGEASEAHFDALARSGELAEFATVHLATHAVVDDVSPELSALVLARTPLADPLDAIVRRQTYADGRLTAREILQTWRLRADLVTLSACESGLGRRAGAEGYLGLASTFLQVGARSVLVSLWNVDDEATARLMERFYRLRAGLEGSAPLSAAAALREAKRWLRDHRSTQGERPFQHPYYWAGFVLLGEGGAPAGGDR